LVSFSMRELFDAGDFDHRRADGRECEPLRNADVSVHHVADVQPDAVADRLEARFRALSVDVVSHRQRGPQGLQRVASDAGQLGILRDSEDCQHGVADEGQHLAAGGDDRARGALEIDVQEIEICRSRHGFGESCGVAQVGVPYERPGLLCVAEADQAVQHAPAGQPAEIGLADIAGDARLHDGLAGDRQSALNALEGTDFIVGEAVRTVGREADEHTAALFVPVNGGEE
jgi:hypothetical protein